MSKSSKAHQVVEMLRHFELEHAYTQRALIDNGEGHRVKPFSSISVKDLNEYIRKMENLDS